jgi:hypothetical protein
MLALMLVASLASAPPSSAAFDFTEVYASTSAGGTDLDSPSDDCLTSGSDTDQAKFPTVGRTGTISFDDTLVVTDPDDAGDTARFRIRGRASSRVTTVAGRPAGVHFYTALSVAGSFSRGASTGCDSLGEALSGLATDVRLNRPTFVTLVVRSTGRLSGSYAFDRVSDPIGGVAGSGENLPGSQRTAVFVRPGEYQISGDFDAGVTSPVFAGDPRSRAGTVNLTATFTRAGAATTATWGTGGSRVSLPANRVCGNRSLTARLGSGAGRLDRVIFYVNGRRRATVGTPAAGRAVGIRNLNSRQQITVRAVLDPKRGRTTAVSRSYAPCTA